MTETVPDAVVQIAAEAVGETEYEDPPAHIARVLCDALARAGWLHDPAEVAALRAVAEAVREHRTKYLGDRAKVTGEMWVALDALDALPPADAPAPPQGVDVIAAVCQFLDADSLEPVSPASQARRAALRAIVDAVPAVPQPADETERRER